MKNNSQKTMYACFIGYIVQAIVNNFLPLLFVMFYTQYDISLEKITLLVTFNFGLQLLVDAVAITFVDRIGYRASMLIAHGMAAAGFVLLTVLPDVMKDPFYALLICVLVYAIGGGLLEVLVSPIMEACETEHKEKAMSLLHSFYCWGHVGVVLISTVFFYVFGISNWKILALVWAIVPVLNFVMFTKVPIGTLIEEGETGFSLKELAKNKVFWVLVLMMVCSGASEQSVSQWASAFAEKGLQVSKTIGDLAGPLMFAVMMGLSRVFYGKYGDRIQLQKFMIGSSALCVAAYVIISLVPNAIIGLIGCAICGISVGIMWPGSFSIAASSIRRGGTTMFALLALAGDLGCGGGPSLVGMVSGAAGDNLRKGMMVATVFPVILLIALVLRKEEKNYGK